MRCIAPIALIRKGIHPTRRMLSSSASSSYYQEPRFPPPGTRTARVFNGLHKMAVLGLVGGTLFLSTYVFSALKHKRQPKKTEPVASS